MLEQQTVSLSKARFFYKDLRDFIHHLEQNQDLVRIQAKIDPYLEVTEICDRTLRSNGPALLFEHLKQSQVPLLGNLFGTQKRVAQAMGFEDISMLREIGQLLAFLKAPEPPAGLKDFLQELPTYKHVLNMPPKKLSARKAQCQEIILEGKDVDLSKFPIQTCWPDDAAPLITWGLVITKNPQGKRLNLGIYRQQVLGPNKVIMRWLAHRGGALDFQKHKALHPDKPFPISVVLGADPATTLAAVTPIPDTLSEYAFAGLLRGHRTEIVPCLHEPSHFVPARAEIILEGFIHPNEMAPEGPFGDHTGYYNEVASFPVMTIERITHRENPIYHSTYTGRPPDEPAILGEALNEVFVPILQKQYPEIVDFYLPAEACSYRMAIVSIKKAYPGHGKQIMLGIWSFLRQFMYTKFIMVVDEDVNPRSWSDVIWALSTRVDPKRDTLTLEQSPIDYLDFASTDSGLGSKMGWDATNKWPGETLREWGRPIIQKIEVTQRIDDLWQSLGIV